MSDKKRKSLKNNANIKTKSSSKGMAAAIGIGSLMSVVLLFGLCALFSLVLTKINNPTPYMIPFAFLACAISSFAGAKIACNIKPDSKRAVGVCVGIVLCLIMLFISFGLASNYQSESVTYRTVIIIATLLFSLFATRKSAKNNKNTRRIKR